MKIKNYEVENRKYGSEIYWECTPICSEFEAMNLQAKCGFDPRGYSKYFNKIIDKIM